MILSVLGTGMVGQTIAGKLVDLGYETFMGSRDPKAALGRPDSNPFTGETLAEWAKAHPDVEIRRFSDLPAETAIFVNAASGRGSIEALNLVGKEKLRKKTLIDIANPLDFSKGMLPTLTVCNDNSLAEQIQSEFEELFVVKSLNTMNAALMVDPSRVPGEHHVFLSGNDDGAKKQVHLLLNEMGWKDSMILDLGDITSARGAEMILPIWVRLYGSFGNADFNFHIARK